MLDVKQLPELPQRQDSTYDQLRDLISVANRLGMHDAADAIQWVVETREQSLKQSRLVEYRDDTNSDQDLDLITSCSTTPA